jgi:hypothetical protein
MAWSLVKHRGNLTFRFYPPNVESVSSIRNLWTCQCRCDDGPIWYHQCCDMLIKIRYNSNGTSWTERIAGLVWVAVPRLPCSQPDATECATTSDWIQEESSNVYCWYEFIHCIIFQLSLNCEREGGIRPLRPRRNRRQTEKEGWQPGKHRTQ